MGSLDLITLVGGMSLFLYGVFMTRDGIQHFSGERFKTIITNATSSRFRGLAVGGVLTVLLQSSTALTVMMVGLAHSGLITLTQVMPMLLGADIGTTLTVQLIAFKMDRYALLIVTAGFAILFFGKKQRTRFFGTCIFGFGLVFFGMKLMVDGVAPFKDAGTFSGIIGYLGKSPFASLLVSVAFTAIVHSSAATIGLVLSLAMGGSMSLEAAIPMVLGANIGTCFTALLAGIGSGASGKRVAVSHIFWKVAGVAIFYPFIGMFADLVRMTSGDITRQIANAHTIFNFGMAMMFLPFTGPAVRLIGGMFKGEEEREKPFGPAYLDPAGLHTPALALGYVTREVVRMSRMVSEMLKSVQQVIEKRDRDLAGSLLRDDDKVNILNREIKFYMARLNKATFTPEQARRELDLVSSAGDLEAMADIISKSMSQMALQLVEKGLHLSDEGSAEIRDFHDRVVKGFDMAMASFEAGDETLARQAVREKEELARLEARLKERHIERLHKGLKESFETSSIHMDYLSALRRVNALSARFSYQIISRGAADRRIEESVL